MAKAELDILLDKLSGRLTGESKFYTTHRHGKTVVSNYPLHRDPKNQKFYSTLRGFIIAQLSKQLKEQNPKA